MASVSRDTATTSHPPYQHQNEMGTTSRSVTGHSNTGRPKTRTRTALSTLGGSGDQQIICSITESRGISPTVGLAFVNLHTTEAVLCQIVDNQTYVRTLHKLHVFEPTEILVPATAITPTKSKLLQVLETNLDVDASIQSINRKYFSETEGVGYIEQLAFREDVEAIKVSVGGNFFATCCLAAALKYTELNLGMTFSFHSMRIKYEPSEGSMMIDLPTIRSLELIQNLQNARSKDCLFGLLNQTLTPMGSRLLRSNILQPLTGKTILERRYDALEELTAREEIFYAVRQALKPFLDVDRVLTDIVVLPTRPAVQHWEQSVNNVILLKQYVRSIPPIHEALEGARTDLLREIRQYCAPEMIADVSNLIDEAINEDVTYQSKPLDLRNQRTYAVRAGVNGLLDVARQTYKEASQDAYQHCGDLGQAHGLNLDLKYDTARQFYMTLSTQELEGRDLPQEFVNAFRKRNVVECQTLDLVKLNQKIVDSHHEVLQMSDQVVQELIQDVRADIAPLFKISEGIALLDMLASLAQVATTQDYRRPELTSTLAVKGGRHPVKERIHTGDRFVPNDCYATNTSRLQIITGCNMSGKSTYIRTIALLSVMAQIGSFVPAGYASFPIRHQLFARVSTDDSATANVSTFAAEMRETAFILHNIDARSLVIVDELGRGTSTRDGLAIAIAVAEALLASHALTWFVTHFRDLAHFLSERPGVVNLHLAVEMRDADRMLMLYKVAAGPVTETNYGLALARVVDLPPGVLATAEKVSARLVRNREQKRRGSRAVIQARRRKLILGLREQLEQASEGKMQGDVLTRWLKKLQDELVIRMDGLDREEQALSQAAAQGEGEGEGEDEGPSSQTEIDDAAPPASRTNPSTSNGGASGVDESAGDHGHVSIDSDSAPPSHARSSLSPGSSSSSSAVPSSRRAGYAMSGALQAGEPALMDHPYATEAA